MHKGGSVFQLQTEVSPPQDFVAFTLDAILFNYKTTTPNFWFTELNSKHALILFYSFLVLVLVLNIILNVTLVILLNVTLNLLTSYY